jgi:hypothetical protein
MSRCSHSRRGVTFIEVCVAGALFVMLFGSLIYATGGARRAEALAALHLGLMESVALAMHQLRSDLRQLSFVPGKPVTGYSVRPGNDYHSVVMRRSCPQAIGDAKPGSSFVLVDYRLVPSDKRPDRFHLVRTESTASGLPLPGKKESSAQRIYRSFTLSNVDFLLKPETKTEVALLHVTFNVVSDAGPMPNWGPFREQELRLSNVLSVLRPTAPLEFPSMFASPVMVQAERPPEDVLAPLAHDAGMLPEPDAAPAGAAGAAAGAPAGNV